MQLYSFAREVSIITDHKPLVMIVKKDISSYQNDSPQAASSTRDTTTQDKEITAALIDASFGYQYICLG